MDKNKIVVIMPAYNAEKTIGDVFKRVPKDAYKRIFEFIVINDGSEDDTENVVKNLKKKYKKIKLVNHEHNKGYGRAQKTGYREALKDGADIAVLLHSDGQYAPELLLEMIKPIEEGEADIVGGSRMLGGKALEGNMPLVRYYGNIFLTKLENFVFRMNLTSYHDGYKAYSRKALEEIPFEKYSNDFYFDSEMLVGAKRKNLKIVEIPIPTRYAGEKSYLNPIKYGFGVLGVIFKYIIRRI